MNISSFIIFIKERFSLRTGKEAGTHTIQEAIDGSSIRGSNLWILLLAIIICSIGLNTNSTTIVIGAMLISPLMGPIIGIGVGLAIYDATLIKKGLRNLAVAFFLSLIVSSIYFYLSPLTAPTKEIMMRISPTIWDVIIAFSGGLVGAIALTRKEKSLTFIPGVAIATALMPPLCVTGYRLVQGDIVLALKSFYLLFINSVFIAGSTFVIAKLLHLPKTIYPTTERKNYVQLVVRSIIILTIIPSIWMTTHIIQQSIIDQSINNINKNIVTEYGIQILEKDINYDEKSLGLRVVGNYLTNDDISTIIKLFQTNTHLGDYTVTIRQGIQNDPNRTKNIVQPLLSTALESQELQTIELIRQSIQQLTPSISQLLEELQALNISIIGIQQGSHKEGNSLSGSEQSETIESYTIESNNLLSLREKNIIQNRLSKRVQKDNIVIYRQIK